MPTIPLGLAILSNPLVLFLAGFALLILFFWYFATDQDKRKRDVGSMLILGVTALSLLAIWPPSETLKGGIDIVGGSSFSLRVHPNTDDNGNPVPVTKDGVTQAITTIEKRLNTLGTKDLTIFQQGDDMIIVQMPGIEPEEAKKVREILEKTAKLELKQVNLNGFKPGPDGRTLAQMVLAGDRIEPGYKAYIHEYENDDGEPQSEVLLLNRRTALDGSDVRHAGPNGFDPTKVDITLSGDGEDKMIALTKDMTPKRDRIAIVLDGKVVSAPVVISTPLGRQFVIEGMSGYDESKELANALLNPLKYPLKVEEERTVSPTLGKAVVKQGIWAGIVGLAITFAFILIYYRVAGFIALIGLTLNMLFLFGAMAMFGFTLTLPGIAGIILTIGMAVDANVLIYERMREEMAAGKSLGTAIRTAYEKAFSAIFDANITSLITSLILFWRASGTVKGFAVTLTIGLLASMFCALLITRVLFRWGQDSGTIKKLSFLSIIPTNANFDFLGKRKIAATVSLSLLFVAVAAFGLKRDASLGIDFTGGSRISFQIGENEKVPEQSAYDAIDDLKLTKKPIVQEESSPASGELLTIRCATEDAPKIIGELRKDIHLFGQHNIAFELGQDAAVTEKQVAGILSGLKLPEEPAVNLATLKDGGKELTIRCAKKNAESIITALSQNLPPLGERTLSYKLEKDSRITEQDAKDALAKIQTASPATASLVSTPDSGTSLVIDCSYQDTEKIIKELPRKLPAVGKTPPLSSLSIVPFVKDSREEVSATLGKEFLEVSVIALLIGLLAILGYITFRYEFSFALGAFVALVHDIIITTGIIVLLGGQLSLIHVGAILTIAGYSINDTIVVFDRIRENLRMRKGDVESVMNGAINSTLSRTILTSATTILTVAVLFIFGGSGLKEFSAMILIGLFVGTYSSIFVASPIVLWWSRFRGTNLRHEMLNAEIEAEINPAG
jgi:SecD/SecF fusion protein